MASLADLTRDGFEVSGTASQKGDSDHRKRKATSCASSEFPSECTHHLPIVIESLAHNNESMKWSDLSTTS